MTLTEFAREPASRAWSVSLHIELEQTIRTFIETYNAEPKPFVWSKTPDEILDSGAQL